MVAIKPLSSAAKEQRMSQTNFLGNSQCIALTCSKYPNSFFDHEIPCLVAARTGTWATWWVGISNRYGVPNQWRFCIGPESAGGSQPQALSAFKRFRSFARSRGSACTFPRLQPQGLQFCLPGCVEPSGIAEQK